MKRQPSGKAATSSRVPALVILVGALLVSVPAGCSAVRFWRRLPIPCVSRLSGDDVQTAFDRVNRAMPADAREGLALRSASRTLAGAQRGLVAPEELAPTMAVAINTLRRSQVGRLQLAAARLWLLEQEGEPPGNWWAALRDYLEGLRHANLGHYQAPLMRHWAAAYQAAGLGPGTAHGLAEDLVGHEHGPLLQFLVPRVRRLIAEREQAGDAAAATTCRAVLQSLLRQWVLEPGPAGLRLLAADLLADLLEAEAGADDVDRRLAVAESLRRWRADYRDAARRLPVAVLDPHRQPARAPAEHERLVTRVGLVTWLGSATITAAAVALLCGGSWLAGRANQPRGARLALQALGAGALVVVGGLLWFHLWPESLREDLRADFSSWRYWWRHPFAAAGLTLALLLLAGGLRWGSSPAGGSRFVARSGAAAAGTWLLLAVILWGSAWAGELARRDYERARRAAGEDTVAAVLGPGAERALSELRRWNP
jgi:hypothetical protein